MEIEDGEGINLANSGNGWRNFELKLIKDYVHPWTVVCLFVGV